MSAAERLGPEETIEASRSLHTVDSIPASEKIAIISIQPFAMTHDSDGNVTFLRTPDGEPLLEHQPYYKEITIINAADLEEKVVPEPGRVVKVLRALGIAKPTVSPVVDTFQ